MNHCSHCGAALERIEVEGRERSHCPGCQRIHYDQLKVGAGGLIEHEGRLLLAHRTIPPFEGCWNLPAGYAEADEHPQQTAVREVYEETGLEVEATGLADVYFFSDDPRGNGLLILYHCRVLGGILAASAEGNDLSYFAPHEIPEPLAGGGHDQAIRAWQKSKLLPQMPQMAADVTSADTDEPGDEASDTDG
jgi:ADP-ribose pyrophosphatase YjhB (NUDIX family)